MGRNLHHLKRDLAKLLQSWEVLWDLPRESSATKPTTRAWPKTVRNAWKAPNGFTMLWVCLWLFLPGAVLGLFSQTVFEYSSGNFRSELFSRFLNQVSQNYEHEIFTFVSIYHKKLEMPKLHKGFLGIKTPVERNCEFSDWKINIRRKNYFQIGIFLITKSFWRDITNRCVVNKISHQHVQFFFFIFSLLLLNSN